MECACSRSQCPVKKAARRLKRTHSQSGGAGDHGPASKNLTARTANTTKQVTATPVKRGAHEQLKVHIPDNSLTEPLVTVSGNNEFINSV